MSEKFIKKDGVYFYETNSNITVSFNSKDGGISSGEYSSLNLGLHVGDNIDNVIKNRQIYSNKIGVEFSSNIYMHQTHSANSYLVTKEDKTKGINSFEDGIKDCDAIYTFDNDITLNAMCADCTPVYFYSKKDNLIGVIHSGWQGTLKQVLFHTLNKVINKHNINPKHISVVIGPSISYDSFEVDKDVYDMFLKEDLLNDNNHYFKNNKYYIDLKTICKEQANKLKVNDVYVSNIDTYTSDDLYSFRRDNITGRHCASISQYS